MVDVGGCFLLFLCFFVFWQRRDIQVDDRGGICPAYVQCLGNWDGTSWCLILPIYTSGYKLRRITWQPARARIDCESNRIARMHTDVAS